MLQVCDIYGAKIVKNGVDKQVEVGKLRVDVICVFSLDHYNTIQQNGLPSVMVHVNRRK